MFSKYLLIILILLFPFGQLSRITLFNGSASLYLHDVLIIVGIIYFLLKIIREKKKLAKISKYFILFIFTALFSLILALKTLSFTEVLISSLYLWRFLAYLSFFYLLKNKIKKETLNIESYLNISILLSILAGLAQYTLLPSLEQLFAAGWDRHLNRLVGSWLDPGFTGLIFVLQIIYLLDRGLKQNKRNIYLLILLILAFISLLLTYSRSSFMALILGLLIYLAKKGKIIVFSGISITFLSFLLLLPNTFGEGTKLLRTSTIISRLSNWEQGLTLINKKPIFGFGFNTLRFVKRDLGMESYKWYFSHSAGGLDNSLLFLIATTGIVGAFFFLGWVWEMISKNKNNLLIIASFSTIFIHGIFSNSWFYPWTMIWMGIILIKDYN